MARPLPSSKTSSTGGRIARAAAKGALNLGSASFNKMFPTIGKMMGGIKGSSDSVESETRIAQSATSSTLINNNTRFSTILDNQNIQNALLERLLQTYKANIQSSAPAGGPSLQDIAAGVSGALGVGAMARRFLSPAARGIGSAAQRAAPILRNAIARTTSTVAEGARAATQASRVAATEAAQTARSATRATSRFALRIISRLAGPVGAVLLIKDIHDGFTLLGQQRDHLPADAKALFTRIASSLQTNIRDYETKCKEYEEETDEKEKQELEADINQLRTNIEAQYATALEIAEKLDNKLEAEGKPANFVSRLLGASQNMPVGNPNETRLSSTESDSQDVTADYNDAVEDESDAIAIHNDAIRVEGDTITYDFEKIKFEASLIKFDGLSLPGQQAAPMQMMNQESATPQMAAASAPSSSPMSAISGGASPSTNSGMQVIQGNDRAPGAAAAAQLPQVTGTTAQILATIRSRESGGNYQARAGGSSASGAYQFIDGTWQSLTRKFGIGTEYPRAMAAPPAVQDAVAAAYVNDILRANNNNVAAVPLVWYTGNAQGRMSAAALAVNRGLTPEMYQRAWLADFARQGGSAPQMQAAPAQQAPSAGPVLAQASTDRVSADRDQIRNTQRMLREFNQQSNISDVQLRQMESRRIAEKKEVASGEVSLRTRILSVFDQIARAS